MSRRAANPGQRPFMVSGDSLKRIAAAVQSYEHGNRSQSPVRFRQVGEESGGGETLKLCKTDSVWEYNTLATLYVWNGGTPPNESAITSEEQPYGETIENVVNKIARVSPNTFVLIGKAENGSWYLVEIGREWECQDQQGFRAEHLTENNFEETRDTNNLEDGTGAQVLLHHDGCLTWLGLTKVTVLTGVSIASGNLVFTRKEVWVFPDDGEPLEDITIEGTNCESEPPS